MLSYFSTTIKHHTKKRWKNSQQSHPLTSCQDLFYSYTSNSFFWKGLTHAAHATKVRPREIHCLAALQVATDHLRRLELWSHQIMIVKIWFIWYTVQSNHINIIIHWHSLKNNCHHNGFGSHLVNHRRLLLALHLPVDQLQSEDQSGKGWKRNSFMHDRLAATPDYCEQSLGIHGAHESQKKSGTKGSRSIIIKRVAFKNLSLNSILYCTGCGWYGELQWLIVIPIGSSITSGIAWLRSIGWVTASGLQVPRRILFQQSPASSFEVPYSCYTV